ncbi:hypothetical protein [Streptomyces sp. bgisy027]|uniref:hypothetical protein n=1 Tax=unclassified Streptomyces TaxID=2593676 RepID=UPI003D711865
MAATPLISLIEEATGATDTVALLRLSKAGVDVGNRPGQAPTGRRSAVRPARRRPRPYSCSTWDDDLVRERCRGQVSPFTRR